MNKKVKPLVALFMLLLFSGYYLSAFSQGTECDYHRLMKADQWRFGDDAGISFNNIHSPELVSGNFFGSYTEYTPGGVSTISDNSGQLLFYTNGMNVWNNNTYIMSNGESLHGNNGATMSSLIVPNPQNSKQYYVFTVDMYVPNYYTKGINYSIVNFSNNGSEVTSKNLPLLTENAQKVCAIKHENGNDYWIVTHGFGDNKGEWFYAYLLSDTINTTPQESHVGIKQTYIEGDMLTFNNEVGYMKGSPDGKKLALAINHDGYVEVFDFDNATGIVSNPQTSPQGLIEGPYGVEFSSDGSKLYVSTSPLNNLPNYIYQFDLTLANPMDNPFEVARMDITFDEEILFGALQLAPDGKIYVAKFNKGLVGYNNLGVVYNPNRPLAECNYNNLDRVPDTEFNLGNGNSLSGLPAFPSDFLDIPPFWSINQCHHDTTNFIIRNTANIDEANWNFSEVDPSGQVVSSSSSLNPKYIFSEPGTYNIELSEYFNSNSYTSNRSIIINPLPNIDIGMGYDTIYILPNSSIRLDAGGGYDIYQWSDGSTNQYLDVNQEGIYSVSITDTNCCSNTGSVYIKYAQLSYPTAFKPTSNITENQSFTVIGNIGAIAKYQLQIFNRWGQLIFESDNPTESWDGNYNDSPVPMGTYVYSSVFTSFESGIQSSIDIKSTGTITLIR